VKVVE